MPDTFKPSDEVPRSLKTQLTRRFEIGNGAVLVFDGLFSKADANTLYEHLRLAGFSWTAGDSPEHSHSVRWKKDFSLDAAKLRLFDKAINCVQACSLSPQQLERIYANFNLFGEAHYGHTDCDSGGITALYCANIEWDESWQGETFFFQNGEPHYVVLPKPGRLVLFDGGIVHRGSPPSRDCWEPRLNVVFKFEPKRAKRNAHTTPAKSKQARISVVRAKNAVAQ